MISECLERYTDNPDDIEQSILNTLLFSITPPSFGFYVYRGIAPSKKYNKKKLLTLNKVGSSYIFPAITSTSLDIRIASSFSNVESPKDIGLLYKILVPKNFPCLVNTKALKHESGVLLPMASRLTITRTYIAAVPYFHAGLFSVIDMDVVEGTVSYEAEKPKKGNWKKCDTFFRGMPSKNYEYY